MYINIVYKALMGYILYKNEIAKEQATRMKQIVTISNKAFKIANKVIRKYIDKK